jgi:hypothetical protein
MFAAECGDGSERRAGSAAQIEERSQSAEEAQQRQ